MKKLISLLLGVSIICSLVGCSTGKTSKKSTPKATEKAEDELKEPDYDATKCVVLGKYKGLKATIKGDYTVKKADVISTINDTLFDEDKDYVVSSKKVVSAKDTIRIDFKQVVNGKTSSEKDHVLKMTDSSISSDITDKLVGHKVGDVVDVSQLGGSGKVTITIKAILGVSKNAMTYDKLTDAYVKENFSFKSVKQYYNSVLTNLELTMQDKLNQDIETELLTQVVKNSKVTIPDNLLDYEYRVERKAMANQLMSYGYTNIKDYLKENNLTEDNYNKSVRSYAKKKLTSALSLEAISKKLKMKFDKKGYKAYVKVMLRRSGYTSEAELKNSYSESYIRKMYVTQYKPMQYIIKNAKLSYKKG